MGKKSSEGGLFERFLIILFGIAIVMLGAYPLTREYGGVRKYLTVKGDQIAKYFDAASGETGKKASKRSRLSPDPNSKQTRSNNNESFFDIFDFSFFGENNKRSGLVSDKDQTSRLNLKKNNFHDDELPLDKVSKDDQKKLDNLIQNVID
ncbi:MAG TPA: hypothetical protein PKA63_08470 [Oligoflexia bacterium]|nr:hypothetical protein [Oligoflexia bacterium]HMP48684.1 hypothetical protein [Oligoflexia bacterium]